MTPVRRAEIERDLDGWESGAYPAGLSPHCLGACCAAARELLAEVGRLGATIDRFRDLAARDNHVIEQHLGRALGYPVMGPEVGGDGSEVCVGPEVPTSLAVQAELEIARLERENRALRKRLGDLADAAEAAPGGAGSV
jgi:hypothetical protein